jgi:hypothetical protein
MSLHKNLALDIADHRMTKIVDLIHDYVKYSEYITLEFDDETNSVTILKNEY